MKLALEKNLSFGQKRLEEVVEWNVESSSIGKLYVLWPLVKGSLIDLAKNPEFGLKTLKIYHLRDPKRTRLVRHFP
jgi:hypothetical protein